MVGPDPRRRARENLTGIVSVLVTGIWLAALMLGQDWWLAFMLFGYVVIVPIVAILFGDEDDVEEWWNEESEEVDERQPSAEEDTALATLRERYARGELTEEHFERKVERLLETDSLEDVEARHRNRQQGGDTGTGRDPQPGRDRESEFE